MNDIASDSLPKSAAIKTFQHGFSLVEIALVLVIVGVTLGGVAAALGPQLENKKVSDTQARIKEASDAIMAFGMANNRLPCPATATSNGLESFCTAAAGACGLEVVPPATSAGRTNGRCRGNIAPNAGLVPARTLGLGEQGLTGEMQDSWAFGIRYAVDQRAYAGAGHAPVSIGCNVAGSPCYPFTQVDGLKNAYYTSGVPVAISASGPFIPVYANPNTGIPPGQLEICATATGIAATTCGAAVRLAQAGFLVWSTARNGAQAGGGGIDEAANLNNDVVYVSHPRSESGGANGSFDDIFLWQTTPTVGSSFVKFGSLP